MFIVGLVILGNIVQGITGQNEKRPRVVRNRRGTMVIKY
jgi:hypothetical protein